MNLRAAERAPQWSERRPATPMNQPYNAQDALMQSIFSDETACFRSPAEPEPWDAVTVRLRIQKDAPAQVYMLQDNSEGRVRMWKYKSDDMLDWYDAKLYCREAAIRYSFLIEWNGRCIHFDRRGPRMVDAAPVQEAAGAFRVIPGFHVPDWAKGATQYQIMADRFRNGNHANDVWNHEYYYSKDYIHHAKSWDELPQTDDYRCFYGGDLPGVMEKLDYLQSLGVEAIYFNPIFVSPSSHKYDTQDYEHIDPHLTVIPRDRGQALGITAHNNARATLYIQRTTDPDNLNASNDWFAGFCQELHRRGMKIILDGVFNHCGSFHPWMDREGLYKKVPGRKPGAFGNLKSPYRNYFLFHDDRRYCSWWNVETLPKLYYERSAELCEEIFGIAEK